MKNSAFILILLIACGCRFPGIDNIPKPKPHREAVYGQSRAVIQQMKVVSWRPNPTGLCTNSNGETYDWTNVSFVLIEAHNLPGPWSIATITQGTNYTEPAQDRMFYALYNTNLMNGDGSDLATTYWTNL